MFIISLASWKSVSEANIPVMRKWKLMLKWLKEQSTEFYETGIHAFIWRWNIAIKGNGDYVEK